MIKITIEKVVEYDETASCYRDPETGRIYDSKYDIGRGDADLSDEEEQLIWDRCVPHSRPTGRKKSDQELIYEQIIEVTEEPKKIHEIINAVNDL